MHKDEDEIDIKALFETMYQYKFSLLFITLFFAAVSAFYAYFQPNIYSATASVKVGLDKGAVAKDVLSMAMGKGAVTEGTEKDLIESRYLTQKALMMVDFSHHYYTTQNYREVELYKYTPFDVTMLKGFGLSFNLTVIDEEHYRLVVEDVEREDGSTLQYNQIHKFEEEVLTEDFQLNIMHIKPFHATEYRFMIDRSSHVMGKVSAVQTSEHSTIFKISYEDTVPLRAQEFANALAEAYVNQNVENKSREATQKLMFIEKQLAKLQKEIKYSAAKLEEFRKTSNTVNVDNKMEVVSTRVDAYEAQLMEMHIKEEMLKNFYIQVKKGNKLETLSLAGIGEKDSSLVGTMLSLQESVVEKKILREDYTAIHPKVIKVNRKIKQLKSIIIHTVENLTKTIEKRKLLLTKSIEKQRIILNDLPESERQYGQLERQFKMNESMNSYLLKMKAEAEMIKASTVSKNRVLDHALLPSTPIKPKRNLIILVGTLLGFILGLSGVFLRVFLDDKIKTEDEIKNYVDCPVVGTIPHMGEETKLWDEAIKIFTSPKSVFAESFRNLRANLQVINNKEGSKVILLTSTVGEEGKTTLSVNLAAIMSMAKKRTIVINMDMRKPTLHEKFNLPNHQGLSELLSESINLREAIHETKYPYLDMISSGNAPINPAESILSKRMNEILEQLKKGYEIIILDTPPIGLVADAKTLMKTVDINLYVIRANHSKKIYLETLKEMTELNKLNNVGIILNDVDFKKGRYGYYQNYGYYEE
jgi:capsular exopolysaccharide synthesis family protein